MRTHCVTVGRFSELDFGHRLFLRLGLLAGRVLAARGGALGRVEIDGFRLQKFAQRVLQVYRTLVVLRDLRRRIYRKRQLLRLPRLRTYLLRPNGVDVVGAVEDSNIKRGGDVSDVGDLDEKPAVVR